MADSGFPNLANPFAIPALEFLQARARALPLLHLGKRRQSASFGTARSRGTERDQLKLLAFAAAAVAASYLVITAALDRVDSSNTPGWLGAAQTLVIFSFSLDPDSRSASRSSVTASTRST